MEDDRKQHSSQLPPKIANADALEPATSIDALSALSGVDQSDLKNTRRMDEDAEHNANGDQSLSHMSTFAKEEMSSDNSARLINNSLDPAPSGATSV